MIHKDLFSQVTHLLCGTSLNHHDLEVYLYEFAHEFSCVGAFRPIVLKLKLD